MNVFTFENRFEAPILAGIKDATIRKVRRDGRPRARDGETISLRVWTGAPYRSKQREFAQRVVKFTFPVRVTPLGIERPDLGCTLVHRKMAKSLGFQNWSEAREWYERAHGLPFDGVLVHFPDEANGGGLSGSGGLSPQSAPVAGSLEAEAESEFGKH